MGDLRAEVEPEPDAVRLSISMSTGGYIRFGLGWSGRPMCVGDLRAKVEPDPDAVRLSISSPLHV